MDGVGPADVIRVAVRDAEGGQPDLSIFEDPKNPVRTAAGVEEGAFPFFSVDQEIAVDRIRADPSVDPLDPSRPISPDRFRFPGAFGDRRKLLRVKT